MRNWQILPLGDAGLSAFAADWDALNKRRFGEHPLLSSNFVNGLLRHFGQRSERLCILRVEGQVRAMCVLRPRGMLVWSSFLPSQAQLGPTMISEPADLQSLMAQLPRPVGQLELLCNDPSLGDGVAKSARSLDRMNHALTMQISLTGSFDDYWNARSKSLKGNMRRYEQRLKTDGLQSRFVCLDGPAEMGAAVARYAALEGSGWKGLRGTALASSTPQMAFYVDLMQRAASTGHAAVHELWLGDELAASRLMLDSGGMLVMLKTTFSESMSRYAPGRQLLRAVIERLFKTHNGQTLEFYTDASIDQLAWATGQRWIQHATLTRQGWASRLLVGAKVLRRAKRPRPRAKPDQETPDSVVEVFTHPDQLPTDACHLLDRAEQQSVELGVAWYRNLVDTLYPADRALRFYVLRQAGQAVAVLPLRAQKIAHGWQVSALSNFYTALYEPALIAQLKPRDLQPLLTALRNDFPALSSLRFSPMDPDSHAYSTLMAACRLDGWVPFEFFAFGNWYLRVLGGWPDYLKGRTGALRSTIRRMSKKFAEAGGRLELVTKPDRLPVALAAYETIYAASWKLPEPYPHFVPGLLQTFAAKGWLRLGVAWIGEKPIAAQIWIVANGRAEIYKLAYDEAYKSYSPGTVLTSSLMEHVFETDHVREVDYLIGDDAYKETWMSARRERWGFVAYNPSTPLGMAGLCRETLVRRLKPLARRLGERLALTKNKDRPPAAPDAAGDS